MAHPNYTLVWDEPRKQRHTATRVLSRLVEIDVEGGRRVEAFIAQDHAPGEEGEVDFGDVWVVLGGVRTKCYMFRVFTRSVRAITDHRST